MVACHILVIILTTGDTMTEQKSPFKIKIIKDGPYRVVGDVPFVKKSQHCSSYGEPLDWVDGGELEHKAGSYLLCRCGKSKNMPYCDNIHIDSGWVGDEIAITDGPFGRDLNYYGPTGLTVTKHVRLCMNSGFCVLKDTDFTELTEKSGDPVKKARAIKMVEDCPSGSLTYKLERSGPDVEPDLPMEIADTYECTQYGEIRGPLWVMGYIPIERADGEEFIPRNRVTLCSCGHSRIKPLCDGTHRPLQENALRRKQREERGSQRLQQAQDPGSDSEQGEAKRLSDRVSSALKRLRDSFNKDQDQQS